MGTAISISLRVHNIRDTEDRLNRHVYSQLVHLSVLSEKEKNPKSTELPKLGQAGP